MGRSSSSSSGPLRSEHARTAAYLRLRLRGERRSGPDPALVCGAAPALTDCTLQTGSGGEQEQELGQIVEENKCANTVASLTNNAYL